MLLIAADTTMLQDDVKTFVDDSAIPGQHYSLLNEYALGNYVV